MNTVAMVLASVALLLSGIFGYRVQVLWSVNHEAFMRAVLRLVGEDKVERAGKLCRAVPRALLPSAIEPLVARAVEEPAPDLAALALVARHSLEQADKRLRRWTWLGVAASMSLLACGLALATTWDPEDPAPIATTVAALAVLAMGWRSMVRLREALQTMPPELLPALIEQLGGSPVSPDEVVVAVLQAQADGGGAG